MSGEIDANNVEFSLRAYLEEDELTLFDYDGFNPLRVREMIEGNPQFSERDLCMLLLFSVRAGFNVQNASRKIKPSAVPIIRDLALRYGVKSSKRHFGRDDYITLSRLQAAYPVLVGKILMEVGASDNIKSDLPAMYRFSAGASLVPRATPGQHNPLLSAFFAWAKDLDAEICFNRGVQSEPEIVEKYAKISHDSNLVPEPVRLALFQKARGSHRGSSSSNIVFQ